MKTRNAFFIFAAKLIGSYTIWKLLYYLLETHNVPWWTAFKDWLAGWINAAAAWIGIHLMGLQIIYNDRNILQKGTKGIFLADHCLAIPAMVVFTLFIAFYKGDWRFKVWFIPLGVAAIQLINALRIAGLAYLQKYSTEWFFTLCHGYVYLILSYGLIFLLIVCWVEVFADRRRDIVA